MCLEPTSSSISTAMTSRRWCARAGIACVTQESLCSALLTHTLCCAASLLSAKLRAQESLVAAEKTKLEAEIVMLKEQSAALEQRMANVKSITIAELMEQDPEMAMEIEDEIRKDNWAA